MATRPKTRKTPSKGVDLSSVPAGDRYLDLVRECPLRVIRSEPDCRFIIRGAILFSWPIRFRDCLLEHCGYISERPAYPARDRDPDRQKPDKGKTQNPEKDSERNMTPRIGRWLSPRIRGIRVGSCPAGTDR